MPIYTALLDIDGTLVASNRLHAEAWAEALHRHGFHTNAETIEPLIGMGGDHLLPALTSIEKDSPMGKLISDDRQKLFLDKYLPRVKPFPIAREFILFLKIELRLKAILATSANEEELKALLKQGGLEGLFDDQTSGSDVKRSKPDPDIVLAALKKADAQPSEAIMIGDTEFDLQAAQKAGIRMVALGHGKRTEKDFPGAFLFADSIWELKQKIGPAIQHV